MAMKDAVRIGSKQKYHTSCFSANTRPVGRRIEEGRIVMLQNQKLLIALIVASVCGCNSDQKDLKRRVQKLEDKLERIEKRIQEVAGELAELAYGQPRGKQDSCSSGTNARVRDTA